MFFNMFIYIGVKMLNRKVFFVIWGVVFVLICIKRGVIMLLF